MIPVNFIMLLFYSAVVLVLFNKGVEASSPYDSPLLSNIGRPSNCLELQMMGYTTSGIYTIYPRFWYNVLPFEVYCDMKTDGGGWTVFQRRAPTEIQTNFHRPWKDYKQGFGDLMEEFWLGNDFLHVLTNQDQVTLRIDMNHYEEKESYATYGQFQIGNENSGYFLTVGQFAGETERIPGDSFTQHNGTVFVTYDKNDVNNCSQMFKGGWWFIHCLSSNLNGEYFKASHKPENGITWIAWHGNIPMANVEMKIRPKRL